MKKTILAIIILLLAVTHSFAVETVSDASGSETTKSLSKEEIVSFLEELNEQGMYIKAGGYRSGDKVSGYYPEEGGLLHLEDSSSWYYVDKGDIDNDKKDEYIVTIGGGSGGYLDIYYIFELSDGKYINIVDEIRIPMRRLIRDYQGESYGLEGGYIGFMHGQFKLEKEQGKTYFTIIENWRSYDKGRDETRTERYKFLWQDGDLKLIDADIN